MCHKITDKTIKYVVNGLNGKSLEYFAIDHCYEITDKDIKQIIMAIRKTHLK